ncbi:MAG: hypothetical protein HY337_02135 [Gemmatimonadetes bacterium]|nr:hypothetical protein [Gemmatimonadota bacterium]
MDPPTDQADRSEALLERVARELGDPGLFPTEVVELHAGGEARRARRLLLRHTRDERDVTRAQLQRRCAEDLRLWLDPMTGAPGMYTFNGIGTRLYGKHQEASDGSHIAILWVVFLFLPLWPLTAYLVRPAPEDGWYFLARAPFPPWAPRLRWAVTAVAATATSLIVWNVYWSGSHTELIVFNGFDRAVVAQVGDARVTVGSRRHTVVEDLPLGPTRVSGTWEDAAQPFESVDVDLTDRDRHTAVYNVANRAVLGIRYTRYGPGDPRSSRWLGLGPVVFVEEKVDRVFTEPPESLRVRENSSIELSVLFAADEGAGAAQAVMALADNERFEQALAVARAELMVHPNDAELAFVTARTALAGDLDAQVAFLRSCLERAPDEVHLHRAYQDLIPDAARTALREEYDSILAAHPGSAMYHYLAGRIADEATGRDLAHYQHALALDSSYALVYRALAYSAIRRGEWATGMAHYDRYAAFGPTQALEAVEDQVRLRRGLRRPLAETLRVVRTTADSNPQVVSLPLLAAHLIVEQAAGALTGQIDSVGRVAQTQLPPHMVESVVHHVRADLAITAGDLAAARGALSAITRAEENAVGPALRLALSRGATQADTAQLLGMADWFTALGPAQQLLALGLLKYDEREAAIGRMPPELADIARRLDEPSQLLRVQSFADQLSRQSLAIRGAASTAAALRLTGHSNPAAPAARQHYLDTGRTWALPGELPYLGPRR